MKFEIRFQLQPDFLLVQSSGDFELHKAIAGIADMLEVTREHKLSKVLFDNRALTRGLYATEKTLFAVSLEDAYLNHLDSGGAALKVATLTPARRLSVFQPFVDTLRGAGIDAQTFDNEDELAAWLDVKLNKELLSH